MKVKTEKLEGPALNWTVATALGYMLYKDATLNGQFKKGWWVSGIVVDPNFWVQLNLFDPSTYWAQGGPIVEREGIELICNLNPEEASRFKTAPHWRASRRAWAKGDSWYGTTPLTAGMRCFVASKLGPEVEVPDELMAPAQAQAQRQDSRHRQVSSLSGADLDRVVAESGLPTSTCGADPQQIAVDDLDGRAMDFAMAVALGKRFDKGQPQAVWVHPGEAGKADSYSISIPFYTSADMADFVGGLALKEGIELKRLAQDLWQARLDLDEGDALVEDRAAATAQLAVLRCFVASRLGSHVAVASEYLQEPAEQSVRQRERGG